MPQSKNKKPDISNADMTVYEVKDERPCECQPMQKYKDQLSEKNNDQKASWAKAKKETQSK